MWQLHQFPLCPFSRKVRLLLGEKGVGYELVRESPWTRRDEFLHMNPAGQTPVMVDAEQGLTLIDSQAICEYFEETVEKSATINGTAAQRAEIRRLVSWFDTQFYQDVTGPLLHERAIKRISQSAPPDGRALREVGMRPIDMAWLRSAPWRVRLASLAQAPAFREQLKNIETVDIETRPDSRVCGALLAGWLAERTGGPVAVRDDEVQQVGGDRRVGHRTLRPVAGKVLEAHAEQPGAAGTSSPPVVHRGPAAAGGWMTP